MFPPRWLLLGLLVPAALAAAAVLVAGRLLPGPPRRRIGVAWVVAIGVGYWIGHVAVEGFPEFPLVEDDAWLAGVFIPAGLIVLSLTALAVIPRRLAVVLELAIAAALAPLILQPSMHPGWSTGEAVIRPIVLAAAVVFSVQNVDRLRRRPAGSWLPLAMTGLCAAGAVAFMSTGSLSLGQRGLSLTAAVAGAWLASFLVPLRVGQAGGMTFTVLILSALVIEAVFDSSLPPAYAVVLALSPWAGWVTELPWFRYLKPWQRGLLRAAAITLPAAIAAGCLAVPAAQAM